MTSKEVQEMINVIEDQIRFGIMNSLKAQLWVLKSYKQDLERLEKLEKVFGDLKSMFEINIGIDCGNEYFIEIKQSDSGISELIPQEDIKIFKEVLECQKD